MSQTNTVLIYSTLSDNCKKLFDVISPFQNEFVNLTGLRLLCVDSKKIRDIITQSKTVIVDKVPTILVIRQDGGLEMYDGDNAFKWTTDIIQSYIKPQPVQQFALSKITESPQIEQDLEQLTEKRQSKHKKETEKPKRPPAGVRTDAGNYDFSSEFEELEEPERKAPQRNIKDNKTSMVKTGGIMALALALQKDRETDAVVTKNN